MTDAAGPQTRRKSTRIARAKARLLPRLLADGAIVLTVVAWALASRKLPSFVLPSPWDVAARVAAFFYEPDQLYQIGSTTLRVIASVAIAAVLGTILAVIPWYLPTTRDAIQYRLQPFLNAMPSLGWALLGVIWFGVSNATVVFVQVVILVPFCLVNMSQGVSEIDPELLEMTHSFSRSGWHAFKNVIFPSLVPFFVAGIRLAYGVAWKIALISELFGSDSGLGYVMSQAQTNSDIALVMATCLVIVLLFVLGDVLLLRPLGRFAAR